MFCLNIAVAEAWLMEERRRLRECCARRANHWYKHFNIHKSDEQWNHKVLLLRKRN